MIFSNGAELSGAKKTPHLRTQSTSQEPKIRFFGLSLAPQTNNDGGRIGLSFCNQSYGGGTRYILVFDPSMGLTSQAEHRHRDMPNMTVKMIISNEAKVSLSNIRKNDARPVVVCARVPT